MIVHVFDSLDVFLGTISGNALLSFTFSEEERAVDTVSISTTFELRGGNRLVWREPDGTWHEHVCNEPKLSHTSSATVYSCTAMNSICETYGDYIEDIRPGGGEYDTWEDVLAAVLSPSRWNGYVDGIPGWARETRFYHESVRNALADLVDVISCDMRTLIAVNGKMVSNRTVVLSRWRPYLEMESMARNRLTYGRDVAGISRTVHWNAITACYGYGKGIEGDGGGYGRKLTFGSINGGRNYVTDTAAKLLYGRPATNGSTGTAGDVAHVFGVYENPECEDAGQLKAETENYLREHNVPGVTYELDATLLSGGVPRVGYPVLIVDTAMSPELRTRGTVSKRVVNLLDGSTRITVGNVTKTLADISMQARG